MQRQGKKLVVRGRDRELGNHVRAAAPSGRLHQRFRIGGVGPRDHGDGGSEGGRVRPGAFGAGPWLRDA